MSRRRLRVAELVLAVVALRAPGVAAQGPATGVAGEGASVQGPLRTFAIPRPADLATGDGAEARTVAPLRQPRAKDSLRTTLGVGYVQGADWGSELVASGLVSGAQVQLNGLLTKGQSGLRFEHGTVSMLDPRARWHVEAGDVFSALRGASRGARLSLMTHGSRRPSIGLYAPARGLSSTGTVVAYRDQVVIGAQTLLDAELASDRSAMLRSRLELQKMELEAFYRRYRVPRTLTDVSLTVGAALWRGLFISAGMFRSFDGGSRTDWNTVAIRVPVARFLDFTVERAFAGSDEAAQTTSAMMASVTAGNLRIFHRHQYGEFGTSFASQTRTVERTQTQSMSSYAVGKWATMTLQLATQRADNGRLRHWEELHATVRLSPTTTVRTVTAVPDVGNSERRQIYLRQQLPSGFALQADYGRISSFQPIARALDRSRAKIMLLKSFQIATPARGAEVRGQVLDHAGRGVAGVRVRLGAYSADTGPTGGYTFSHVPRGEYELSLDPELMPADVAWDGRGERLKIADPGRIHADLRVTPLNAVHGRVFIDRNSNRRYDPGEGVPEVVLRLAERLTTTDLQGAYAFYNVWPGTYVLRIHSTPPTSQPWIGHEQTITLRDGRPVTGADFTIVARIKPIVWEEVSR